MNSMLDCRKNGHPFRTILIFGLFLVLPAAVQAQQLEWATRAGGPDSDVGFGMTVDGSGNSYVTGSFQGTVVFGSGEPNETPLSSAGGFDIFVAKYDHDGLLVWAKRAGGSSFDRGQGVAVDAFDNSYVTGRFRGTAIFGPGEAKETALSSAGFNDIFVAKYSGNGLLEWAKRAGGSLDDGGSSIVLDASGNSYVTGDFQGSVTFGPGEVNQTALSSSGGKDIFVAKYDGDGLLQWATRAGGSSGDVGNGVSVHASGNSYVTGFFQGTAIFGPGEAKETALSSAGGFDIFVANYDRDGLLVWANRAGGSSGDIGNGVAVHPSGDSYVTGLFGATAIFGPGEAKETALNSAGFNDIFVAKYDGDGRLVWAKGVGGTNIDVGNGVAVHASGNSYVTGFFQGTAIFGPGEAKETALNSAGFNDIFVAKYDGDGLLEWAKQAGGSRPARAHGIALDASGNSYVTGRFRGAATFGSGEANERLLSSAGSDDIFVAKFSGDIPTSPLPHDFLFLAGKDIVISGLDTGDGDIHSNNDIVFKTGRNGTHFGAVTAVDDVRIKRRNTIVGNVTAGDGIKNSGIVTGAITENADVPEVPLPRLSFSAGGDNMKVRKDGSLTLPPGSYGKVRFKKRGTLFLSSGEYSFEKLETALASVISIDVTNGPVTINVEDKLEFDEQVRVEITPSGEAGSREVTFNVLYDGKVEIAKRALVLGTLIAPEARVEFGKSVRFRGAVCAKKIKVGRKSTFLHHSSAMSLPKSLPKDEAFEGVVLTSAPEQFELEHNYPNPFNPSTTITFAMPEAGEITLSIYNLRGQIVKTLYSGAVAVGHHQMVWDGTADNGAPVASGVYIYQLRSKHFVAHKKLLLAK